MNSIKNAIVTITLLAVGYGSYVVLKEPTGGQFSQHSRTASIAQGIVQSTPPSVETPLVEIETPAVDVTGPETNLVIPDGRSSTPSASPLAVVPAVKSPTTNTSSAANNGQGQTAFQPALPPLPDLIDSPASVPELTTNLDAPSIKPPPAKIPDPALNASGATELQPIATKIEPPVAALVEPHNASSNSAEDRQPNGPFANPLDVGRLAATTSPEVQLPRIDIPSEASGDLAPSSQDAVGPIPPQDPSEGSIAFERVWTEVQQDLLDKELSKALKSLTPWCSDSNLNKEQYSRCIQLLDQLAGSVVYSRESHLEPPYLVQAGETLDEIASAYGVPQELLAKINGIAPPYALTTGEEIKVIRGPFRATISLFKSELILYVGSSYAGRFPVTIGRDLPPESAFYEVAEKSIGRTYFDRRLGREILKGETGNRYGGQWLGLRGEHITTGHSVGIHGRPPKYPGDDIGSISLAPLDAEDVFSILSVGSRVEVRP